RQRSGLFQVICYRGKLLKRSFQALHYLCDNHIRWWQVGAVFQAWKVRPLLHPRYGVFEPEPSRWEVSEWSQRERCDIDARSKGKARELGSSSQTDGQVERPTERERRSQHVEISVESPAVASLPLRVALDVSKNPFHSLGVSKVEQIEAELRNLSQAELRQIREWLDD